MYKLNRNTRYEIIKELIKEIDKETLNKLVNKLWDKDSIDNIEERREELLEYLEDMNTLWHEKNIDFTDRQYLKIETKEECEERLKKQFETFIKNKEKQSLKEKALSDYYLDEEELVVFDCKNEKDKECILLGKIERYKQLQRKERGVKVKGSYAEDGTFIPDIWRENKEEIIRMNPNLAKYLEEPKEEKKKETIYQKIKNRFKKN